MSRVIFIGGTGRSGTNVLRKVLATAEAVASPHFETRYTVDPCGIAPFLRAFEKPISSFEADSMIRCHLRFLEQVGHRSALKSWANKWIKRLPGNVLEKRLTGFPYAEWDLNLHSPGYSDRLRAYRGWFEMRAYPAVRPGLRPLSVNSRLYFAGHSDLPMLIDNASEFIEGNISASLARYNASIYVEDNTFNLVYASTLARIVSGARFIHVSRDPMDVVTSYCSQRWCPQDAVLAGTIVKELIDAIDAEIRLLPQKQVLEVAMENLVEDPVAEFRRIAEFADIEDRLNLDSLVKERANVGRSRVELERTERSEIERILESAISRHQAVVRGESE